MTKKKLKWLAPLTAGALAVTMGITAISVPQNTTFAQELSSSEVVKLAAYNEETANEALTRDNYGVEYWVKHTPTASITTGEYDGIKYTLTDGVLYATNADDCASVTQIILPSSVRKTSSIVYEVNADGLDLTQYTSLTKVILQGNTSVSKFYPILTSIPNDIDVYTSGNIDGIGSVINMKNLYICETFKSHDSLYSSLSTEVGKSNLDNVFIADWVRKWCSSYPTLTNADGTTVSKVFLNENQLGYTIDFFLPYSTFRYVPSSMSMCIDNAYAEYITLEDVNSTSNVHYIVNQLKTNVDTFVLTSNQYIGTTLRNAPNRLVFSGFKYLSSNFLLNNSTTKEYVLRDSQISTLTLTSMMHATDLWLAPSSTPTTITTLSYNSNYNANLVIHIPEEYKTQYQKIIDESFFEGKIEYYNLSDYDFNTEKVILNDGNTYKVSSSYTTSFDYLNENLTALTAKGYTFTTDEAIDTQITAALAEEENKAQNPDTGDTDNPSTGDTEEPGTGDNTGETDNPGTGDNTGETETPGTVVEQDVSGYKALGNIYYSSDKSIQDILSIAGNYILQKDGERYASIDNVKVKFTIDGNRLSTSVYVNNSLEASIQAYLHKIDNTEYGEFIYMQSITSTNGELLIDTDSTTTKNINEIYSFILQEAMVIQSIEPTTVTDFNIKSPSGCDLTTTYVHNNGNTYRANCEALSFDLDDAIGINENIEVTIRQIMSPDDDLADPESEYSVKTIEKIYVPGTMSAHGIPSAINNSIVMYQNNRYTGSPIIHMVTSTNKHDGANYEISVQGTLPDGIIYQHKIPVEIIDNAYGEAFVVCSDGTIIEVLSLNRTITLDKFKSDTNRFISDVLKKTETVTYAQDIDLAHTAEIYGSKVGEKSLEIVVSGIAALEESNANHPVDVENLKKGYTALSYFVFSDDYKVEEACKLLAKKILYYYGSPVSEKYDVKVNTSNKTVSFEFLDEDGEKIYSFTSSYKVVKDSKYSFVAATSLYNTGVIITDVKDVTVATFMNEIMKEVVLLSEYNFTSNVMMSTSGSTNLTGIMHHMNQNYYSYDYTVEVMDTKKAIEESTIDVDKATIIEEIQDTVDDWTSKFKEKFENNQAFKIASMAIGTILGIVLFHAIYIIFKKIYKWLKR